MSATRSTSTSRSRVGLLKDGAREEITLGILQPVEEVIGRRHLERVAQDRRPGVGRRPEADRLRPERDQAVIPIRGAVMESDVESHGRVDAAVVFTGNSAFRATAEPWSALDSSRARRRNGGECLPKRQHRLRSAERRASSAASVQPDLAASGRNWPRAERTRTHRLGWDGCVRSAGWQVEEAQDARIQRGES